VQKPQNLGKILNQIQIAFPEKVLVQPSTAVLQRQPAMEDERATFEDPITLDLMVGSFSPH